MLHYSFQSGGKDKTHLSKNSRIQEFQGKREAHLAGRNACPIEYIFLNSILFK